MSLRKDIEKSMFVEMKGTRIESIAELIGADIQTTQARMKELGFKEYVDLMRALRDQDEYTAKQIMGMSDDVEEAYNMGGTVAPGQMRQQQQADAEDEESSMLSKQKKTMAMQRLGRKNFGGSTAQQAAAAVDQAQQGKALTPIQRKAMAAQAANMDALASDPRTAQQFRNLLNKLNR